MNVVKYTLEIIKKEGTSSMLIDWFGIIHVSYALVGFSTLYAGLLPTLIRTFFATGALFITYEHVQGFLRRTL